MKKILLLVICTGFYSAYSQTPAPKRSGGGKSFRINGYANYAAADKVDSYYSSTAYYNGRVDGGFQWGVGMEYMAASNLGVELSYQRLDTKAPLNYYDNGVKFSNFKLATNYILLGGNRYFKVNEKVEPYFGAQIGMCVYNLKNPVTNRSGSGTKFAWGIKGGTNLWLADKVGLKLQLGLMSVVQSVGGGLYFGTGGAGAGLASYSTIYQFNAGGGLVFRMGN